jgi:uncharacterized membrane protein YbhN (UPF0104 family)
MPSALFELKLFSLVFTGLLWRWSLLCIQTVPFDLKKAAYDHNRLSTICYFLLLALIIFTPTEKNAALFSVLSSLTGAGVYAAFAILDETGQSTIWRQGRNRIVTLGGLAALAFLLATFVQYTILIPVLYALFIAHGSHHRNQATLTATMADLDAVRKKILEVNAHQVAEKIMEEYSEVPHNKHQNHAS